MMSEYTISSTSLPSRPKVSGKYQLSITTISESRRSRLITMSAAMFHTSGSRSSRRAAWSRTTWFASWHSAATACGTVNCATNAELTYSRPLSSTAIVLTPGASHTRRINVRICS